MAGAEIIASAIGILCLIIFGYILVGGILTNGENAASAQKAMTMKTEEQMQTKITIADAHFHTSAPQRLDFRVKNTGNEIIHDITRTDIMLNWSSDAPLLYKFGTGALGTSTWYYDGWLDRDISMNPERINPGQWDPGEYLWVQIWLNSKPDGLSATLANGVKATTTNIGTQP